MKFYRAYQIYSITIFNIYLYKIERFKIRNYKQSTRLHNAMWNFGGKIFSSFSTYDLVWQINDSSKSQKVFIKNIINLWPVNLYQVLSFKLLKLECNCYNLCRNNLNIIKSNIRQYQERQYSIEVYTKLSYTNTRVCEKVSVLIFTKKL